MSIPPEPPELPVSEVKTKVERTKIELRRLLAVSYNEYQDAMAFVER
jgi:hypothetical protein